MVTTPDKVDFPVFAQLFSQLGCEPGEELPHDIRMPMRALLKRMFKAGVREAPLVEGWCEQPPITTRLHAAQEGLTTIVIPVRGAHEALRLCLQCVAAHTNHEITPFEVVIVCPRDEFVAVGELAYRSELAWNFPARSIDEWGTQGVRILPCDEPLGFPAACNAGARIARGDVLVFLNSDVFVGSDWLRKLTNPIYDPTSPSVAAGPMGTNVSGHQRLPIIYNEVTTTVEHVADVTSRHSESARGRPVYHARRLVGFCLAVRRDAFERVGGWFDRWTCPVGMWDDDRLSLALTLAFGAKALAVVPDLLVLHKGHASFAELNSWELKFNEALAKNGAQFRDDFAWIMSDWAAWMDSEGIR